jgi:hypothetical protein
MDSRGGGAIALGMLCLLAATWAAASGDSMMQDRFKVDGSPDYLRGMSLMNHMDNFTISVPIDGHLKEDDSFEAQIDKLKRICRAHKGSFHTSLLYKALLDFPNHNGLCSLLQMKIFLFANQVGQTLTPAELALKRYVNHFAPEKFKACADTMRPNIPKRTCEEKLDELFMRLFGLPNATDDSELYSRVRDINLFEDKLEFDRTLKKAHKPATDARKIERFIFDHCNHLLANSYNVPYQSMIFANALGLACETDPRMQKLIEYDHICWHVTRRKDSMQLFENIKRQLERLEQARPRKSLLRGCLGATCARN